MPDPNLPDDPNAAAPPPPAAPEPGTDTFSWPPQPAGATTVGAAPRRSALDDIMAQRQADRDSVDPAKFVGTGDRSTGKPDAHDPGTLGDFGRQVWHATLGMGEGILGAVSAAQRAAGADPEAIAQIEQTRHSVSDYAASIADGMSPKAQAALQASLFGGKDDSGKDLPTPGSVGWSNYVGARVAELVPQLIALAVPGGIAGKVATKMAFSAAERVGAEGAVSLAAKAGTAANIVTTGGVSGTLSAGDAYNSFTDAIDHAKPEDLMGSPIYKELIARGTSDTDARKALVSAIAPVLVAAQFSIGAVTGVGLGGLVTGKGASAITSTLGRRAAAGAAEGGGLMGFQAGAGTAAQQAANVKVGVSPNMDAAAIAKAAAGGVLGGAVLGAGLGALHGSSPTRAKPAETPVDPAAAAALGAREPTAPTPSQPQTEMFTPGQMGHEGDIPRVQPDMFGGQDQTPGAPPRPPPGAPGGGDGQPWSPPMTGAPEAPPTVVPGQGDMLAPKQAELPLSPRGALDSAPKPPDAPPPDAPPPAAPPVQAAPPPAAPPPAGAAPPAPALGAVAPPPAPTRRAPAVKKPAAAGPTEAAVAPPVASSVITPEAQAGLNDLTSANSPAANAARDARDASRALDSTAATLSDSAARGVTPKNVGAVAAKLASNLKTMGVSPENVERHVATLRSVAATMQMDELKAARLAKKAAGPEPAAAPPGVKPFDPTAGKKSPTVVEPPAEPTRVDRAAAKTETDPTEAQKESGDYKKGRTKIGGLTVDIETAKGGTRSGIGPDGKPWSVEMPGHYGEILRTEGADGEPLDAHLGPQAHEAEKHPVWVIDQINPKTGLFDEHKPQIGFASRDAAVEAYDKSFSDGSGPKRRGAIVEMPFDRFKEWATHGDLSGALAFKPKLQDTLRAKRAAEKARMSETGTPVERTTAKPHVTEGEDKPPVEPPAPPARLDRDAAAKVLHGELPPGILKRALEQIDNLMALKHGDLEGALREWAGKAGDRVAGSTVRRAEVADRLLRRFKDRGLNDTAKVAAEARAEARSQPDKMEDARIARASDAEAAAGDNHAIDDARAANDIDVAHGDDIHVGDKDVAVPDEDAIAEAKGDIRSLKDKPEVKADGAADELLGGDEPSRGVMDYGSGEAAERAEGSNTTRKGHDLLDQLRLGVLSPEEAALEFGEQLKGTGGRRRAFSSFADFLKQQIEHYGRDATKKDLLEQLDAARAKRAEQGTSTQAKSAETAIINKLEREMQRTSPETLRELERAHQELTEPETAARVSEKAQEDARSRADENKALAAASKLTGVEPKTIKRLQGMVASARDRAAIKTLLAVERDHQANEGHDISAEEQNRRDTAAARKNGVDMTAVDKMREGIGKIDEADIDTALQFLFDQFGGSSHAKRDMQREISHILNSLYGSADQQINTALQKASGAGRSLGLHDALDAIIKARPHEDLGVNHSLATLARVLRGRLPNLEVRSIADGVRLGDIDKAETATLSGMYFTKFGTRDAVIYLGLDRAGIAATMVHEGVHAASVNYLESPRGRDAMKALELIRHELGEVLYNPERGVDMERVTKNHMVNENDVAYAASDPHEMLTMMMTDASTQAALRNLKPPKELAQKLADLGFTEPVSSAWGYFKAFVRRALGLPDKGGPVTDTMLDHALRVGAQVLDRAHQDNLNQDRHGNNAWKGESDGFGPSTYARRSAPTSEERTHYGRDVADTVMDVIHSADPKGVGDTFRRALLQGANMDSIVRWNRKLFTRDGKNGLVQLRSAMESIAHSANEFHTRFSDTVADLTGKLRAGDSEGLSRLMNDATLAEARLGTTDAAANAHHTTPEAQDKLAALQARYDALSPAAKTAYGETRAHYDTVFRMERKARVDALIRSVLPDATPAQADTVRSLMQTRKGLDEFLSGGKEEVANAFGADWKGQRDLVRGIAQLHRQGFVRGDYFPLRRFGDYVVRYGSAAENNLGVEMFEKRGDAEARRAELAAQDAPDLSQVLSKRESHLADLVPDSPVVNRLAQAMESRPELRKHADQVRDLANSILLETATRSEAARTRLRRRKVAGAGEDAARVLATEFLASGHRIAHLEHGLDRSQALADMRLAVDGLNRGKPGEQIRAEAVLQEAQKRMSTGDDAASTMAGFARRATTLGYVQSLMSPSHMLVNSIEMGMNAVPLLGARHGAGANLALLKAMRQVMPTLAGRGLTNTFAAMGRGLKAADWRLSRVARDQLVAHGADKGQMGRLFEALDEAGLIDHTQDRELQRIANPSGIASTVVGKSWQRFLDLNAAGVHAVDVANKSAVAKAAFDLEMRKSGGDEAASRAYAVDTVRNAAPNYNLSNKARISTSKGVLGGFAAPLTQFKQYGIHMYGMLANLTKESFTGAPSEAKTEARRALAGVLATHALMAGGMSLIADPLRYIGGIYDFAFRGSVHDYQNNVREFLAENLGPTVGELISRGLPHALGIDIHRRVGLNDMLAVPELQSFDGKGFLKVIATAMTGAAGEDAASIAGGVGKVMHGDWAGGIKDMAPRVIRDVVKAGALASDGVVDPRGKAVLPAERLGAGDYVAQALGFQPAVVSEAREGRNAVRESLQEAKDGRNTLTRQWLDASPGDRAAVNQEIQAFNAAHPAERITMGQLLKQANDRKKAASTVGGGVGLNLPRRGSNEYRKAGAFANVGA